ncbi:acyl--CoA ligase [Lactobacillus sp. DCY120]|uniref:Acyl--CoA ligase n=1 Tax=Bombilactobacillus apium TaxID=2675299 RepID=A0A850R5E1_9LACO|nr:class I adenylate-forming enzyme family protein [Bombilactobacillus apium]NVY97181.1 acyl--CoA ligase [Bombilactobacillus apium]
MEYKSLSMMFADKLKMNKNKYVVIDSDRKVTYQYLAHIIGIIQNKMKNLTRFKEASVIAFRFRNSVEYIATYIATIGLGKIAQPIYYEYNFVDLKRILLQSKADFFIDSKNDIDINEYLLSCPLISSKWLFNDLEKSQNMNISPIFEESNPNDPVLYLTSSGTTGSSKVIAHSNLSLLLNIEMHINSLNLGKGAVGLAALPLPFGYSNMTQFLVHIYLNGTLVLGEALNYPTIFLNAIRVNRVTDTTVVPYFLSLLLYYMNNRGDSFRNLFSLKYILFGGGVLSQETFMKLKKLSGKSLNFVQTYGSTECGPRITTKIIDSVYDKSNLGKPLNGVKITITNANNTGNGLIKITTPSLMLGYVKKGNIEKNTETSFIPGDVGKINKQGELIFKSRVKNMLKYRGFNLQVEEVEHEIIQLLKGDLSNLDIRVGQSLEGDLVLELHTDTVVKEGNIKQKIKGLSAYMRPTIVKIVDKIPRTANGKIKRPEYLLI